jgi:hypothetical protein
MRSGMKREAVNEDRGMKRKEREREEKERKQKKRGVVEG